MRTVLVEDNPSVRNILTSLIENYCPALEVLGIAANVNEGIDLIKRTKPQLVFLDVEMPDGTGFDLLQKLSSISFQVIFITAHEKYALQAIKFSALDYLLKPIDVDDLMDAVEKATVNLKSEPPTQKLETLIQNLEDKLQVPSKLVLKDKYGIQIVQVVDIIRLEANGSYTQFFIKGLEPILISKGIKEYHELLPSDQFFRSHQSHIVNLDYLIRYDKRDGDMLHLIDGSKVPLATRKRESLIQRIESRQ